MSESGEMGTSETKINWKQGMVSSSCLFLLVSFSSTHITAGAWQGEAPGVVAMEMFVSLGLV